MRVLLLFTFFFLDVKVRAEVVSASAHRKTMKTDGVQFVLASQSLLEIQKQGTLRLVKGQLYLESEHKVKLTAPFGSFECMSDCLALLERRVDAVKLQSLGGYWRIRRLGDETLYGLPPGMEMTLGRVDLDGAAEMEFPQSVPWDSTIRSWARLFPGTREEFKVRISEFRPVWREAVEAATDLQHGEAGRTIASHEADLARIRARQRAQEREDESLRKLFRAKNNIDF